MKDNFLHTLPYLINTARDIHSSQVRKYTSEPYEMHLAEVAATAFQCYHLIQDEVSLAVFTATCWWHDSMEDQDVCESELRRYAKNAGLPDNEIEQFVEGVLSLSDLETGNRAQRQELSRGRLRKAPGWAQVIKCYDIRSNIRGIHKHDPKFFKVWSNEKLLLLDVLKAAPLDIVIETRKLITDCISV